MTNKSLKELQFDVEYWLDDYRTNGAEREAVSELVEVVHMYGEHIYDDGRYLWVSIPHTGYCMMSGLGVMEESNRAALADLYDESEIMEHQHNYYVSLDGGHLDNFEYISTDEFKDNIESLTELIKSLCEHEPMIDSEAYYSLVDDYAAEYVRDYLKFKGVAVSDEYFGNLMESLYENGDIIEENNIYVNDDHIEGYLRDFPRA